MVWRAGEPTVEAEVSRKKQRSIGRAGEPTGIAGSGRKKQRLGGKAGKSRDWYGKQVN